MALVHADNFSIYGTTASLMLNGVYAEINGVGLYTDPDGLSGGHVLGVGFTGTGINTEFGPRYVLTSTDTKVGIALRVWFPSLPSGSSGTPLPIQWRNVANTPVATITVDSTGRLSARSGNATATVIGTTTNPAITANGWYHIEAIADITAQTIEVRVEGATVLNLSGLSLSGGPFGQVVAGGTRSTGTNAREAFYTKDLVIYDSSGSYNNSFLGSVLVHSLLPDSDASLNWTPSTGTTGWGILDNIPPNDSVYLSAPYNSGGPPYFPNPYVATLSNLPVETTSVKGIITFVRAAKSDGGDGSLQVGVISDPLGSPATALGANRPITVAQTYWRDVFEVDPATSAPWLPDAVNDAEIRLNRTS